MKLKIPERNRENLSRREPHYEIIIFVMFFMAFLFQVPDMQHLNKWTSIYYVLSYVDFGFKSRLVMGSVIRLFTNYVSVGLIYTIITAFSVSFIAFISLILGRVVRKLSNTAGVSAELLIALFIACPISIQYLFNINNFGRFDLQSIMITTGILFCAKSSKTKWAVPLLCLFAMMFNYNFIIMYMPVIGIVLLNEYFVNKKSKSILLILIISCLTVASLFLYFRILATATEFESLTQMKIYLAGITDIKDGEYAAFYDFFYPINKFYFGDTRDAFGWFFDLLKVYGPFMLFSTAPVFAVIVSFWIRAFKNAQQKSKKFVFLLCLSAPAASLPMFLAIDWDRWVPTLFISQFMLVLYFIAVNDSDAVDSLYRLKKYFERHLFLLLVIIAYLASSIFSNSYSVYVSVMLKYIDNFLNIH